MAAFGGFEDWSDQIRAPLLRLGMDDPYMTRESIVVSDPDRESLTEILITWHLLFSRGLPQTLKELVSFISKAPSMRGSTSPAYAELTQLFCNVASRWGEREIIDMRRLGEWCSGHAGRVIDGLSLRKDAKKLRGAAMWYVACTGCAMCKRPTKEKTAKEVMPDSAAKAEARRRAKVIAERL